MNPVPLIELQEAVEHGPLAALPPGSAAVAARTALGLTATECAAVVGVSERTWQRWEQGQTACFASHLLAQRASRLVRHLQERSNGRPS